MTQSLNDQLDEEEAAGRMTDAQWRLYVFRKLGSIEESAGSTLAQVTKTNGRVSKLETWRSMAIGAMAVVTAIVVPLFLKVVTQ